MANLFVIFSKQTVDTWHNNKIESILTKISRILEDTYTKDHV